MVMIVSSLLQEPIQLTPNLEQICQKMLLYPSKICVCDNSTPEKKNLIVINGSLSYGDRGDELVKSDLKLIQLVCKIICYCGSAFPKISFQWGKNSNNQSTMGFR